MYKYRPRELPLCVDGNLGHNGVISQSLYTRESGDSERTYQNHDQIFALLWSFGQVFEPMGYNTPMSFTASALSFKVSYKDYNNKWRLVVFAVWKLEWPRSVASAAEQRRWTIMHESS